jgi:hypothetical protein
MNRTETIKTVAADLLAADIAGGETFSADWEADLGRDGWDQFEAEYMPGWRGLVVRILVLISGYAIWISN